MSTEKLKIARLQLCIPAWLDDRMRERAPIRKRGDLNKFFTKLLIEKFGDAPVVLPPTPQPQASQTSQ